MATYCCSDVHGEADLLKRLLCAVSFSPDDELLVLGDFLDKGVKSFALAYFIMRTPNIRAVLGNHEYDFLKLFDFEMKENEGDEERAIKAMSECFGDGSEVFDGTLVEYLSGLPFYIEGEDYIGVHAGLSTDDKGVVLPIKDQTLAAMIYDRRFVEKEVLCDKTVLFGHTPCSYHNDTGYFIKTMKAGACDKNDLRSYSKIRLDTGVHQTKMLGILRLDDMKEFYVRAK